jgi:SOS-response transcriptional repressor LexA
VSESESSAPKPLTERQREILDIYAERLRSTGLPPSTVEIANQFGVSAQAVQKVVNALVKRGFLLRTRRKLHRFTLGQAGLDLFGLTRDQLNQARRKSSQMELGLPTSRRSISPPSPTQPPQLFLDLEIDNRRAAS